MLQPLSHALERAFSYNIQSCQWRVSLASFGDVL